MRFPFRNVMVLTAMTLVIISCGQPARDSAMPVSTLSSEIPVMVTGGQIQGASVDANSEIIVFKGVPYAAPPVGDLRWRSPQPVVAWDGVYDATVAGANCMQAGPPELGAQDGPQSEDCLVLNVWAPKETKESLPVMVWIHGGGFFNGSASLPIYNGTRFAEHGVVLVSFNYRLNVFGFFSHPALSAESLHGASGNYGLMDMVAALEWVRDNIETFGGDPNQVTIFGNSAGGGAVMSVMLMPQSEGLFHRAISESTWVYGWDRPLKQPMGNWGSAEAQGVHIAEALGGSDDEVLDMIRAATAQELQKVANAGAGSLLTRAGYIWAPNTDGWIIPDDPHRMYQDGRQHNVPLITGMTADEGASPARGLNVQNPDDFEAHVRAVYPEVAEEVIAHYDLTSDEAARSESGHLITDMYFAGPVRLQANSHGMISSPVWLYNFARVPPTSLGAAVGAYHGAEVVYVFDTMTVDPEAASRRPDPLGTNGDWTEADRQLSETMMSYWTQFAATGNPNRDDLPLWPEFDPLTDRHLTFADTVTIGEGLHDGVLELFNSFEMSRRSRR